MIRRMVRLEVSRAVELSEQRLRRVCREEVAKAIKSLAPQPAQDSVMRRIAREEAAAVGAAEGARAVSGAIGAAVERGVRKAEVRALVRCEVAKLVTEARPTMIDVRVNRGAPIWVDGDTHAVLPDLLLALGAACHVFLVGPAGTGKSTMANRRPGRWGSASSPCRWGRPPPPASCSATSTRAAPTTTRPSDGPTSMAG